MSSSLGLSSAAQTQCVCASCGPRGGRGRGHPHVKSTGDPSVSSLSHLRLSPDTRTSLRIRDWLLRQSFSLSSVRVRRSSSTETVCASGKKCGVRECIIIIKRPKNNYRRRKSGKQRSVWVPWNQSCHHHGKITWKEKRDRSGVFVLVTYWDVFSGQRHFDLW